MFINCNSFDIFMDFRTGISMFPNFVGYDQINNNVIPALCEKEGDNLDAVVLCTRNMRFFQPKKDQIKADDLPLIVLLDSVSPETFDSLKDLLRGIMPEVEHAYLLVQSTENYLSEITTVNGAFNPIFYMSDRFASKIGCSV